MTDKQSHMIADAIIRTVHGPLDGPGCEPMGMEAITMALAGEGRPGHDSVAKGLHDIADAIRDLSEALSANKL